MGKRKRIVVDSVENRIAKKRAEYARMIAAEKQLSIGKAYREMDLRLRLGLLEKGVDVVALQ